MLTRWAPESLLSFNRFNKMMEDFFGTSEEYKYTFVPAVDVKETDKEIVFYCELPGLHQEDVEVELMGDKLTIKGRHEFNREDKREDYVSIERSYGSFQRMFRLDMPVKSDQIEAVFKDGVLTVTVPKAATITPKKVAVTKK